MITNNTPIQQLNVQHKVVAVAAINIQRIVRGHLGRALAKFNKRLQDSGLSKNNKELLIRVFQNDKTLPELYLRGNNIRDDGAKVIADALKDNTTLTTLDLGRNHIGVDGAKALGEALKKNTTLTTLVLSLNRIGVEGATAIVNALKDNTTLTVLGLGGNQIRDDGAIAIAEALKQNSTLTSLYLGGNNIGAAGAIAIAEALQYNKTLTSLYLNSNEIGAAGAIAIAEALEHNTTLTSLYLGGNNIGAAINEHINEKIERNKLVNECKDALRSVYPELDGMGVFIEIRKHIKRMPTKFINFDRETLSSMLLPMILGVKFSENMPPRDKRNAVLCALLRKEIPKSVLDALDTQFKGEDESNGAVTDANDSDANPQPKC